MRLKNLYDQSLFILVFHMCLGAPAHAADQSDGELKITGQASLVSNYIWRGLSQSWGKAAAQITVTADHRSGAYLVFFASNVTQQFIPNASLETDWSVGYRNSTRGVDLDVGGNYTYYPGSNYSKASFSPVFTDANPRTLELYVNAAMAEASLRAGYIPTAFYGWNVNNSVIDGVFNAEQPRAGLLGTSKGALNIEANYAFTLSDGWSVQTTLGRQTVPNTRDINWNYARAGVTADLGGGWSVAASATSHPKAFEGYGSLTNNGQRSAPGSSAVLVSLAKTLQPSWRGAGLAGC